MKSFFRLIIISMVGILLSFSARSQVDFSTLSLAFNPSNNGGTARVLGFGGANTALGGDLTSISTNPAGLGFYNRSDVAITPVVGIHSNGTDYLGSSQNNSNTKFIIGNLGLVINKTKPDEVPGNWKGGNFGFSYNRTNNYNDDIIYGGVNTENDYLDFVTDFANTENANVGDFYLVDLPYYTYLVNDYSVNGSDTTFGLWDSFVEYASPDTPVDQSEQIKRTGFQNRFSFSYGGNAGDRFYFGFGLGIISLKYENEKIYKEVRYEESILNNYSLYEFQKIEGTGVNGNFGIIVRPISIMTIGLSYLTPTAYGLTDEYQTSMNSIWNDSAFDVYPDEPDFTGDQKSEQAFTGADALNYTLTTPGKLSAGLAVFIKKNGFITADIEWLDNGTAKYKSNDYDFSLDNENIRARYKSTVNFKLGGEYRKGALRLRAGYNHISDPYVIQEEVDRSTNTYSGGFGIRKKAFYLDFTVLHSITNAIRAPYIIYPDQNIGSTPLANIGLNITRFVLTTGFHF